MQSTVYLLILGLLFIVCDFGCFAFYCPSNCFCDVFESICHVNHCSDDFPLIAPNTLIIYATTKMCENQRKKLSRLSHTLIILHDDYCTNLPNCKHTFQYTNTEGMEKIITSETSNILLTEEVIADEKVTASTISPGHTSDTYQSDTLTKETTNRVQVYPSITRSHQLNPSTSSPGPVYSTDHTRTLTKMTPIKVHPTISDSHKIPDTPAQLNDTDDVYTFAIIPKQKTTPIQTHPSITYTRQLHASTTTPAQNDTEDNNIFMIISKQKTTSIPIQSSESIHSTITPGQKNNIDLSTIVPEDKITTQRVPSTTHQKTSIRQVNSSISPAEHNSTQISHISTIFPKKIRNEISFSKSSVRQFNSTISAQPETKHTTIPVQIITISPEPHTSTASPTNVVTTNRENLSTNSLSNFYFELYVIIGSLSFFVVILFSLFIFLICYRMPRKRRHNVEDIELTDISHESNQTTDTCVQI